MDAMSGGTRKAACPTISEFRRLESNQHPPGFSGMLYLRATPENPRGEGSGARGEALAEPAVGLEPTQSALRERCSACRASPANFQHPRQESNLHDLRLRRAACIRHTPGMLVVSG